MRKIKKIYIAPEIVTVDCSPASAILEASLPLDNSGPSSEEDFDGEATGAARGDWDDIWKGM